MAVVDEPTSSSLMSYWPTMSDRPFRVIDAAKSEIAVDSRGAGRELQMWCGFLRAGALLTEAAISSKNWPASLTFPALFAFRHGLELAMKAIIRQYGSYANVRAEHPTHDLERTWGRCRAVITGLGGSGVGLDAMGQIVRDFHRLDPTNQSFRYAYDVHGLELPCSLKNFDAYNLLAVMERVDAFFELTDAELETRVCIFNMLLEDVRCPCCDRRSVEHVPGPFQFPVAQQNDLAQD